MRGVWDHGELIDPDPYDPLYPPWYGDEDEPTADDLADMERMGKQIAQAALRGQA